MAAEEPPIIIRHREQLLDTLSEAAEIEHNLMCCYLYAAWSLKTEPDDGIDPEIQKEIRGWQRAIVDVAIDEMTHLTLVSNLMNALGGVAHLHRPNFPVSNGYHPADLQVRLAPFNRDTLQHFIYLERPEGSDEPDGQGFDQRPTYSRGLRGIRLMPSAQDYRTVGHLYRSVEDALKQLAAEMGEPALFCGDPALQVCPNILTLTGLVRITDLASACRAIETIVEQGEGASNNSAGCHYARFVKIRESYDAILARDPDFKPGHPVASNPVMRKPIQNPEDRVWIEREDARQVLDLGNAVYNHMLRFLAQGFAATDVTEKRLMINTAIDMMMALDPLARELARLKANDSDDCNAGLSFATLRTLMAPKAFPAVFEVLKGRIQDLAQGGKSLQQTPRVARAVSSLETIHANLGQALEKFNVQGDAQVDTSDKPEAPAKSESLKTEATASQSENQADAVAQGSNSAPEIVEGQDITLVVDMKRCVHSRFCVTGAPKTFIANVEGPWLHPDESDADLLVRIAHDCPSGAIAYRGKTRADECAPEVNMMRIRENGPNAINAPMTVAGEFIGYRATFCRCGQSKNKPYCDGSHHDAGFAASGEPETISLDPLSERNGPLAVDPQRNGPLRVTGNLEICAGTGRVVKRVEGAVLCRCGHSKSKPFCDGSHRAAGFEADGV
ncbi:ferritin-like domain-containing protein [Asticcacaulis solisilvae]|uniref:ferritin-like domain-containing protein n=1 Tax=Asticcacaulis solisilvae TaxID=1217274 RepID=UPI003FD7F539